MIKVTVTPPVERDVTISMTFTEAAVLRKFLGRRFSTAELRASNLFELWNALQRAGVDSE